MGNILETNQKLMESVTEAADVPFKAPVQYHNYENWNIFQECQWIHITYKNYDFSKRVSSEVYWCSIMSFPGLKETYFLNREAWVGNEEIYRKTSMVGMPLSQNTKQLPQLPCTKTLM